MLNIGKECATRILSYIAAYFESNPFPEIATDIGSWYMKANWRKDRNKSSRSMIGKASIGKADLARSIREAIPISN